MATPSRGRRSFGTPAAECLADAESTPLVRLLVIFVLDGSFDWTDQPTCTMGRQCRSRGRPSHQPHIRHARGDELEQSVALPS
jgi:hypothetical protein